MSHAILLPILILIAVSLIIFLLWKRIKKIKRTLKVGSGLGDYLDTQENEKEEKKKKILGLMKEKEIISNNEVQNLLSVSDSTVTRYLDELEKEEKIIARGDSSRETKYRLKTD